MSKILNLSLMTRKQIVDKTTNKISEFIVLFNTALAAYDWIFIHKLLAIISMPDYEKVGHVLKETLKGNPDEGKTPREGKSLSISESDDCVTITIYTQVYGKPWVESHKHTIEKSLFDAYILIVKNEASVAEKEKKKKVTNTFSLEL